MSKPQAKKKDWHPADVVAALWKQGVSMRALSLLSGYSPGALKHALRRPYPRAEKIIADAIGVPPSEIWPSRYTADGQPYYQRRRQRREVKMDVSA